MNRGTMGMGTIPAAVTILLAVVALAGDPLQPTLTTRPRQAAPVLPSTIPAGCEKLRDRAIELHEKLQPELTAEDEKTIRQSLSDASARGQRIADGWSAYAGGELLLGNVQTAAWAGLTALRMEWRGDLVANVGIYFYYLNRLDDAEAFLSCARELNPGSPFAIEAQALVAMKRKDFARATELIELAVRLLPGDMNVRYNAGVIHHAAGNHAKAALFFHEALREKPDDKTVLAALEAVDPAAANAAARPRDALDRLVEECTAFLDETVERGELASEYGNRIRRAQAQGEWTDSHHEFEQLREHVSRNRERISTELQRARETRFGPPDPFAWNSVVYACADSYAEAIHDYESVVGAVAHILIMSSAYEMDPVVYAGRFGRPGGFQDQDYVVLDEQVKFNDAMKPVYARLHACVEPINGDTTHCFEQFCTEAVPLWREYRDAVFANCRTAEAGYPQAAEDWGNYWLAEVRRGAEFGNRATKLLKPTPLMPESHQQTARSIVTMVQTRMTGTIELMSIPLTQTNESLIVALDVAPKQVLAAADGPPRGSYYLCPQDGSDPVSLDEDLDPFLEALKAAATFEHAWGVDCDLKIGGFSANLTATSFNNAALTAKGMAGSARVSAEGVEFGLAGEGVTANVDSSGRVGAEVSYSAAGGSHGIVGDASVKISSRSGGGGQRALTAQLEGKVGAGINLKGVEAACYPFSGKMTFNARAFADSLAGR